jgi:predicted permease
MPETLRLLQMVLPIFLVMAAGYLARRLRILTEEADQSLLGILVKLFIPCLAFDVILGNEALLRPSNLFLPPLIGFCSIALGLGISLAVAKFFLKGEEVQRAFACTTSLQNYSYIPLPLCQSLFGPDVVGVLFSFNLGVDLAMWSLATITLSGQRSNRPWWAPLWNPPIVAVVTALALNLAGAGKAVPSFVSGFYEMLGLCAVPLGLILSGALLSDFATPRVLCSGGKTVLLGIGLRMVVLPALLLGTALILPSDPALRCVLAVQAAMPSAVFPIVLTKLHHGDVPTAIRVVLGTSMTALITIPILLGLGLRLIS